ncbi:hypothetical protein [Butyrivibrio proteoclasticus]|uniref:hypothetical protein n=1 Tax=Butyrivibrio proteoclasticus TaxID=43305 RepID=UPI000479CBC4|nr:hypothetical protein [Butyrivibrio proteoclasticus]
MNLKRKWPAVCIWVIFLIFDVVMVVSSSFFIGLFPSRNNFLYSVIFTVLGLLIVSVITFALGRVCDFIKVQELKKKPVFSILYYVLLALILIGGAYQRAILVNGSIEPAFNSFLYEDAMIGSGSMSSHDLLSVCYTSILRVILLFTGNKTTVAFFFEIGLFLIFILCSALAVKKLLGYSASLVFAAYTAFMPIFYDGLRAFMLSTDTLFFAMFGLEMLIISIYLKRAIDKHYVSKLWIVWYLLVGAMVGFMTYVDPGTFIAVLPLLVAQLFFANLKASEEVKRLLFVLLGAVVSFAAFIIQEKGAALALTSFGNWFSYFFKNVNVFSMFWINTNYKLIYLITVLAMGSVIVGFWKNRKLERVSPWLLSFLFVFTAIPFMGKTRMNDQLMVTIYYAFILACGVNLITFPGYESEETMREALEGETQSEDEIVAETESQSENETESVSAAEPAVDGIAEVVKPESVASTPVSEPAITEQLSEPVAPQPVPEPVTQNTTRFVPVGMILPEDDDDGTPNEAPSRMKMPEFKGKIALERNRADKDRRPKNPPKTISRKDDFDIAFRPGDDFDI